MVVTIKKREVELKYTFNSFDYMEDFDMGALDNIEQKPFKIIKMVKVLLLGAVNNNPKFKVSEDEVAMFLEEYIVENPINDLLAELMDKLQTSNFFKSLQKK